MPISRYILPSLVIHDFAFLAIDSYAANPLFFAYRAIAGSCVAASFTRLSLYAIYGGFDTIISNGLSNCIFALKSARRVCMRSVKLCVLILWRAIRNARLDLSIAMPVVF